MTLVRILAELVMCGKRTGDKLIVLCGLDSASQIIDGEWYGNNKADGFEYPFVLRNGSEIFYGYEEHTYHLTNLGRKEVKVGEYFTVIDVDDGRKEYSYHITHVTSVAG